jgi:ESCRT-I complex subunit VPS37
MRLRHATTEQNDLSETLASSFVRSTSSETAATLASSKEVDDFVKEFRELRKMYHKRVMWGDRWSNGQVAWRDD